MKGWSTGTRRQKLAAIAHSHPLDQAFVTGPVEDPSGGEIPHAGVPFNEGIPIITLLQTVVQHGCFLDVVPAITKVLPSNQDIRANYLTGAGAENLYLPYRLNDAGQLSVEGNDPAIVVNFGPVRAILANPLPPSPAPH
jgi:hypothetical protein